MSAARRGSGKATARRSGRSAATRIETILAIETTLDDISGQTAGYVMERALALGALDAYITPCQMKKSRPGLVLTVLARPAERRKFVELLLTETPTLGARVSECEREVLERESITVETEYGAIRVKVARGSQGDEKAAPEYEDCREAAIRHQAPFERVRMAALRAYTESK